MPMPFSSPELFAPKQLLASTFTLLLAISPLIYASSCSASPEITETAGSNIKQAPPEQKEQEILPISTLNISRQAIEQKYTRLKQSFITDYTKIHPQVQPALEYCLAVLERLALQPFRQFISLSDWADSLIKVATVPCLYPASFNQENPANNQKALNSTQTKRIADTSNSL